jgi:hypothetical protein
MSAKHPEIRSANRALPTWRLRGWGFFTASLGSTLMHPALRPIATRRVALATNMLLVLAAIVGSFVKGGAVAGAIPFALFALAVYTDNSVLQRASLGFSGLVVGSGFLVATLGNYGEYLQGGWRGEAILVGVIMIATTLPTFLYLYVRHGTPPVDR